MMYLWCELVSNKSPRIGINILPVLLAVLVLPGAAGGLGDLEEGGGGGDIPDLEPGEVDAVDVCLGGAEVIFCHSIQPDDVTCSDNEEVNICYCYQYLSLMR